MKRLWKSLLAVCLLITMTACGKSEDVKSSDVTINDQAGRTVTLEKPAEKIVSGYYIATSTLIGLGHKDKLVGVEMKADKRMIYKKAAPQVVELPAMGNKKSFNVEECAKAKPDVVFLPNSLSSYIDKLEELGMKVIILNPETMKDYDDAVKIIAKVCGADEQANTYFQYRDDLEAKYLSFDKAESKQVYFAGSEVLEASGEHMFQGELINKAGGVNVINEGKDTTWMKISKETLLKKNPAYIFAENKGADIQEFYNDGAYQDITAVKEKQVYEFPSKLETWDTPNLSSCLGELYMASILYPDKVSKDDVIKEAKNFYQKFYQIDVNEKDLGL